jgi:hypothetical protein
MRVIEKILTYATPASPPNVSTAYEYSYYAKARGYDKIRLRFLDISDDIFDHGSLSFSDDNGKTWHDERPHLTGRKTPEGTFRRFDGFGWVDPVNHRLVTLTLEGLFRKDNSLEGLLQYYLRYRVSEDGGRTDLVDERVIQSGTGFTPDHPIESVWIGRNAMMMPSIPPIVRTRQGHLVVCTSISLPGPDGQWLNPGGGFTWLEEQILYGEWQPDGRIAWTCGPRLSLPPERSTRGLDEMTLTEMPDGRILLVMRGSNGGRKDPQGQIPAYKWFSVSSDAGRTWADPQPWRYSDGTLFHSPASMSQIVRHSNGTYYWFGNITPHNPNGNLPRYPLVAAEIDPETLGLRRETVFAVATRQPGDPEGLQLSNFSVHEDRADGCFLLHVPWFMPGGRHYVGDSYLVRVEV